MKIFDWFKSKKTGNEKRFRPSAEPPAWFAGSVGGRADSGVDVTDTTAMTLSSVYDAVRIISETVASLPLILYRRLAEGKERATDHPLYNLLHNEPNPEMDSVSFRECSQAWMCLRGNAYAEIEWGGDGYPKALWPIAPRFVTPARIDHKLRYIISLPSGGNAVLFPNEILHTRGFSLDGVVGLSVIAYARESIGLGLAEQEYGARLFANNTTPKGVIEYPGKFKDKEVLERLKSQIETAHRGLTNAHRMMILEEGMKWAQTGISPEDSQFLESRQFNVTEVARWFRLPPHMLGDLSKATFSNIEQQSIDFVVHSIRPWLVRLEQQIRRSLLLPNERNKYFAEHLIDALLRGDIKSRYEAYAIGKTNGWLNSDEIREKENMNPIPDGKGKEYLRPLNMAPAGSVPASPSDKL